MVSYKEGGQVVLFGALLAIGLQFLFETEDYTKDLQKVKQIPVLAKYSEIICKAFGSILIFLTLLAVFYNRKQFRLLLFFILVLSNITAYNPFITGFCERSLINLSLIGVMLLLSKNSKKGESAKKNN